MLRKTKYIFVNIFETNYIKTTKSETKVIIAI